MKARNTLSSYRGNWFTNGRRCIILGGLILQEYDIPCVSAWRFLAKSPTHAAGLIRANNLRSLAYARFVSYALIKEKK